MKKIISIIALCISAVLAQAQNPDVLIDSMKVVSPYWGLRFESGTVTDSWINCGSSNTDFVVGQQYKLIRFPINLANMGDAPAYFGRLGQNGITHDSCYSNITVQPTDFINIPNFVIAYILDSCGNVIASNRKTDWNIQNNSSYAISYFNGQYIYPTQTFGQEPTIGTQPNALKSWLESMCGPLNNNLLFLGGQQLEDYTRGCQLCDSLILFSNFVSNDEGIIQLPNDFAPGNYYLSVAGNFYMMNQGSNCYKDSICIPFGWNGEYGISSTFPYNANGVTFYSQGFGTCVQQAIPQPPTNVTANLVASTVEVNWVSIESNVTSFGITPYLLVNGNIEKAIPSLAKTVSSSLRAVSFSANELKMAQEVGIYLSGKKNNIKFRFKVRAINSAGQSSEVSSGNPAIMIK